MINVLKDKVLTARKKHYCMLCGEEIPIGTRYVRQTNKYDGYIRDYPMHQECYKLSTYTDVIGEPIDEGWTGDEFSDAVCGCFSEKYPEENEEIAGTYIKVKFLLGEIKTKKLLKSGI